jgi:SAM-dependent methyltransferase
LLNAFLRVYGPRAVLADLMEVRAYVAEVARGLDPSSRYISDLLAMIDRARDVRDLERLLEEGCRGQRHAGPDVFARMTLEEKLLANLITPETTLFRFSEGEMEAIDSELLPRLRGRTARVLIVPCSHGEEAFTIAAYLLKVDVDFTIRAFDVQPALIEEARTGRLTFGYPLERLRTPGYVADSVLSRIRFDVGDAFALPLAPDEPPFDVVLCRNFAGYFTTERAEQLVAALGRRVAGGGALFLDSFCIGKMPSLVTVLLEQGARAYRGRPVFVFPPKDSRC